MGGAESGWGRGWFENGWFWHAADALDHQSDAQVTAVPTDWSNQLKSSGGSATHLDGVPHAPMITDRVGGREVCEEERCVILERQRLTWLPASSHSSSSSPASHPLPDNARLGWILSTAIQLHDYTTEPLILSVAFFGNSVLHNHCGEIFTGRFNCHINWFKSDNFQPVWTL